MPKYYLQCYHIFKMIDFVLMLLTNFNGHSRLTNSLYYSKKSSPKDLPGQNCNVPSNKQPTDAMTE